MWIDSAGREGKSRNTQDSSFLPQTPIRPLRKQSLVGGKCLMTICAERTKPRAFGFAVPQGYIKYSALFYGYYSDQRTIGWLRYRLPMAYFMVGVSVFGYSLMIVIRS